MTPPPFAFDPGRNCWRVEPATRMAVIVDAQDYFTRLRSALLAARETVYLVGWDFDLRIEMRPGESDADGMAEDGWPNALGDFLQALTDRRPDLHLFILKWDGAMLAAIGKQVVPTIWMQWFAGSQIHFALDSHHPVGACHHSKIVVIDDQLAFCGGIDVTEDRWDTRDHTPDDPCRTRPNGEPYGPWHDVTTALEGPAARALGDLARMRWHLATGDRLDPPAAISASPWPDGGPDDLEPHLRDVDVAIARTAPRYHGDPLVNEIEHLYLDAIRTARDVLYLESQYLAAGTLCDALEERLREPDGPEVVVINPRTAESFIENEAMHSVRSVMIDRLRAAGGERFAIFHPVNAAGTPIYVHAKVVIADDRLLRVGSSNIDNRSMGFDTECDVAVMADSEATRDTIRGLRHDLLAEHLGCEADDVAAAEEREGSLIGAINALNGARDDERGLRVIESEPLDPLERALAETRLFDPRYRPKPRERAKHAVKRGIAPYHVSATLGAGGLLGLAAIGLGGAAAWSLYRHWRDDGRHGDGHGGQLVRRNGQRVRRDGRLPSGGRGDGGGDGRGDFPTPAIVTHRTTWPSP